MAVMIRDFNSFDLSDLHAAALHGALTGAKNLNMLQVPSLKIKTGTELIDAAF